MRAIWTCPLCGWRQPDDRPRICGRNGEPCSGDRSWMPALSSEVQPVGSERSDDERSVHADPLDTSRHVDGAGWQTIDSAPRDGTRVDLRYSDDIGTFSDARWRDDLGWSRPFLTSDGDLFYTTYPNASPTHWRPLPEPPAALAQPSPLDTSGRVEGGSE